MDDVDIGKRLEDTDRDVSLGNVIRERISEGFQVRVADAFPGFQGDEALKENHHKLHVRCVKMVVFMLK